MDLHVSGAGRPNENDYLYSRGAAWFAFAMTIGLMVFDYIDRQVVVSIFPHLKAAWDLSDKQLGGLASIVSITVALGAIPVALIADRASRVKSIAVMAIVWSLASISCMFTRNYGQLLAARGIVGLGEAGYGSVGAALIASHFPLRIRGTLMAAFFASASFGSVLGVMLGGVVGVPGLILAVLYLFVRDYRTIELTPTLEQATQSAGGVARRIMQILTRSRTLAWIFIGAPAQLIVLSSVWAWLPSFLNRVDGLDPAAASVKAALVVLIGAVGAIVSGIIVDRAGRNRSLGKFVAMASLCVATFVALAFAFGAPRFGVAMSPQTQFALIAIGGFLMTCTAGPVSAIVIDVVHPGVRATGSSVLALVQNLFGLALGPFISGALSDSIGLETALSIIPIFSLLAAGCFLIAARSYEADKARANEIPVATEPGAAKAFA